MTGMGEMPGGRSPLTLGGWPGEGVSAGDEGRLLYAQHTGGGAAGEDGRETQENTFIQKQKANLSSGFVPQSHFALMHHSSHISPTNAPLQPNAKDYFLLIFRLRRC